MVELKAVGIPKEMIYHKDYICMPMKVINDSFTYYEYYVRDLKDHYCFEFMFGSIDYEEDLAIKAIEQFIEFHEDEICSDIN